MFCYVPSHVFLWQTVYDIDIQKKRHSDSKSTVCHVPMLQPVGSASLLETNISYHIFKVLLSRWFSYSPGRRSEFPGRYLPFTEVAFSNSEGHLFLLNEPPSSPLLQVGLAFSPNRPSGSQRKPAWMRGLWWFFIAYLVGTLGIFVAKKKQKAPAILRVCDLFGMVNIPLKGWTA